MFFILSKTAAFFVLPSNLIISAGVLGLLLMATRYRRAGLRLAVISLTAFLFVGFLPVGRSMMNVLENRFPAWTGSGGAPDGIVILGGAISNTISRDRGATMISGGATRITAIAKLARQFPAARIVFSSGNADLIEDVPPETTFLGPLLDDFGVPRARVELESRSRNTYENAVFTKEMVKPKPGERWLLVTSAAHMPRAVGCFRQAGFPAEAYPVDWRTRSKLRLTPHATLSEGLGWADEAVHEWVGLIAYWLSGKTPELLPGP